MGITLDHPARQGLWKETHLQAFYSAVRHRVTVRIQSDSKLRSQSTFVTIKMWLINTKSFELEFFIPPRVPEYAILSHTWGTDEVTFQDFQDLEKAETKKGFLKIKMTCQLAQSSRIGYAWVDTCCIDKNSSAELSESINSMYSWYQRAKICYAYIDDWSPGIAWTDLRSVYEEDEPEDDESEDDESEDGSEEDESEEDESEEDRPEEGRSEVEVSSDNGFPVATNTDLIQAVPLTDDPNHPCCTPSTSDRGDLSSSKAPLRWFTRGWTLQELIAPTIMEFYDNNWNLRGSKSRSSVIENLSRITGISSRVLRNGSKDNLREICLGQRMSWAAHRETSREEDIAYSLLGIFQINMPLLYGEGHKAFFRLQEEILKSSTDLSILAWKQRYQDREVFRGIFSHRPSEFRGLRGCRLEVSQFSLRDEIVMTNKGARVQTSLFYPSAGDIDIYRTHDISFLYLGCFVSGRLQGIFLKIMNDSYVRAEPRGLIEISASMRRGKAQTIYLARDMDGFSNHDYNAALFTGLRVKLMAVQSYVFLVTESWPPGLYDRLYCSFLTRDMKSILGYLNISIMSKDHTRGEWRQVACFMAVCRTFRAIARPQQQDVSVHLLKDTHASSFANCAKSTSEMDPVTAEHSLFTHFESSSKHWGQEMVVTDDSNGSLLRIKGELTTRKRTWNGEHKFSHQSVKISLKVDQ